MSRDSIHQRIDELLGLLSIHNSRLSLHTEKLSQLDIDVLRKQCIDLYDEVNKLALQGKIKTKTKEKPAEPEIPVVKTTQKETQPVDEPVEKKGTEEIVKPKPKPVAEKSKPNPPTIKKVSSEKKVDDEMLSLFEKFSSKPIDTISKGMSVAKRFEFQSAFFDGDNKEYNAFIKALDSAGDRESAFEIYHDYKNRLDWDNEELKDELKALMYRKYH